VVKKYLTTKGTKRNTKNTKGKIEKVNDGNPEN
jgi:hypothetical protein